jgi:hypothetical protein
MQLWIRVFGIAFALQMVWTPTGWAQESAPAPGDVGTLACREAQIDVQSAVGNQTQPRYKNHGQYVSAASHAANVPLKAGEITKACHSCIVSGFAGSTNVGSQNSCGPALCAFSGSPGWTNLVRAGGNGAFTSDTTAQGCCLACVANLNCAQWAFLGNSCQHNVAPNTCVASTPSALVESGNIRCQ